MLFFFSREFSPKIYVVRLRYRVVKLVLVAVFQWLQTGRSTIINQNIAKGIIRSVKIEEKTNWKTIVNSMSYDDKKNISR